MVGRHLREYKDALIRNMRGLPNSGNLDTRTGVDLDCNLELHLLHIRLSCNFTTLRDICSLIFVVIWSGCFKLAIVGDTPNWIRCHHTAISARRGIMSFRPYCWPFDIIAAQLWKLFKYWAVSWWFLKGRYRSTAT